MVGMSMVVNHFEEARLDAFSRHKHLVKMLDSDDGKKLPEKIRKVFERARELYWKRVFILHACNVLLGGHSDGMTFSSLAIDHPMFKEIAEQERKAIGHLFIQLHVNDLQLCDCSDLRECKNCRECVDFLKGNMDYEKLKEYVKGRMFPIGWHDDPEFKEFREVISSKEGGKVNG